MFHGFKRQILSKNDFNILVNNQDFDYTWYPHPKDPPYIYVFGNQHWSAEIMPTVEYNVPGVDVGSQYTCNESN